MLGWGAGRLAGPTHSSGHRPVELEGLKLSDRSKSLDRLLIEERLEPSRKVRSNDKARSNGCDRSVSLSLAEQSRRSPRRACRQGQECRTSAEIPRECRTALRCPPGKSGSAARSWCHTRVWRRRSRSRGADQSAKIR